MCVCALAECTVPQCDLDKHFIFCVCRLGLFCFAPRCTVFALDQCKSTESSKSWLHAYGSRLSLNEPAFVCSNRHQPFERERYKFIWQSGWVSEMQLRGYLCEMWLLSIRTNHPYAKQQIYSKSARNRATTECAPTRNTQTECTGTLWWRGLNEIKYCKV